jgi:hypothetical protein
MEINMLIKSRDVRHGGNPVHLRERMLSAALHVVKKFAGLLVEVAMDAKLCYSNH